MVCVQAAGNEDLAPIHYLITGGLLEVLGCLLIVSCEVLKEPVNEAWVLLKLREHDLQREHFLGWLLLRVLLVGLWWLG